MQCSKKNYRGIADMHPAQCVLPDGHLGDHQFLAGSAMALLDYGRGLEMKSCPHIPAGHAYVLPGDWKCGSCERELRAEQEQKARDHAANKNFILEKEEQLVERTSAAFLPAVHQCVPPGFFLVPAWLCDGVDKLMGIGGDVIERSQFEQRVDALCEPVDVTIEMGAEFDRSRNSDAWRITCPDGSTVTFPTEVFRAFMKTLSERDLVDEGKKCKHGARVDLGPCGPCSIAWKETQPSAVASLPEKTPDNSIAHLDTDLLCDDE
jgi:hypothetical protein